MKAIIYFFISLILLGVVFGGIEEYKYYKTVDTSGFRNPVWVELDSKILDVSESDGEDIRIYSGNVFLPYHIDYSQGEINIPIKSISASSVREMFRGQLFNEELMYDGSYSTYYQNDGLKDPEFVNLVVELNDLSVLKRLEINGQGYDEVIVSVQKDSKMVEVVSKEDSNLNLNDVKTQKLYINIKHDGSLKINELKVIGYSFGKLLFIPETDMSYVYFGKAFDDMPEYSKEGLSSNVNTPILSTSYTVNNPLFVYGSENELGDNCPSVSNPSQLDRDNDGVGDKCDNCVFIQNAHQQDTDKDGIGDVCDNCRNVRNPNQLDKDLDGVGYECDDEDRDGVYNPNDNCLLGYNPNQQDVDRDGIGDECEDDDGDGIENYKDNCKQIADSTNMDSDKDGKGDKCDNCPNVKNSNQFDEDGDGIGDLCEDEDEDGVIDSKDNCKGISNNDQIDWDKDGLGDKCDNCPEIKNNNQADIDRDGIGDKCDEKESRLLENPWFVWSIIIIAGLGLVFFALRMKTN